MKQLVSWLLVTWSFLQVSVSAQSFNNPILSGFYPDPSICRAGNDYYIVTSSFAYYPGLPIFHSKDLLNWKQIGHAMNRPAQLRLEGAGVSRGLFAPAISYHNGLFYIVCTLIDRGGNFVITAKDPAGPWSDPVWLPEVDGIDPSLFFENDKAYIVYNSVPPSNKSLYDGHRSIRINAFDPVQLKVIGDNRILVNGGTDISKSPVWIEAPHVFKRGEWYYLLCAEGGTGYHHSEVVFRTRDLAQPFMPFHQNPILTQRHLDANRKDPVTTTGHADFVETPDGTWWAVFLGCRPYDGDYYNTGRETFMAPVAWKDEWPVINPDHTTVQYTYPIAAKRDLLLPAMNGNFLFRDEFDASNLNMRYSFLRTVTESWYTLEQGQLVVRARPVSCSSTGNPSFIGFRQSHLQGYAATAIQFNATDSQQKAGLIIFQNEQHYYFLCKTWQQGKPVIALLQSGEKGKEHSIAKIPLLTNKNIYLKIVANGDEYSFFYATAKDQWKPVKEKLDARFLSTKEAGGFVGCFYGLYATSGTNTTAPNAVYDWFEIKNNDLIYQK